MVDCTQPGGLQARTRRRAAADPTCLAQTVAVHQPCQEQQQEFPPPPQPCLPLGQTSCISMTATDHPRQSCMQTMHAACQAPPPNPAMHHMTVSCAATQRQQHQHELPTQAAAKHPHAENPQRHASQPPPTFQSPRPCRTAVRHAHRTLLIPLILLCISTFHTASAQNILCPCLPMPTTRGCNATQTLISTSSPNFVGGSLAQCMPKPRYNPRWNALFIHQCWNLTCLPKQFASSLLNTSINSFTDSISQIPAGQYTVLFTGPPADGGNTIAGELRVSNAATPTIVRGYTNNSILTVPTSGLSNITVSWTWPAGLSTGNYAQLTLQSLDAIKTTPTTTVPTATAVNASCSDVYNTTELPGPIQCPNGQIRVWVWGNVTITGLTQYPGLNYTSQATPFPKPTPANITRCVDIPFYDVYSQQFVWNLTWSLPCYSSVATGPPYVIVTEPFQTETNDYILVNGTMRMYVLSSLMGTRTSAGSAMIIPVAEFGDNNRTAEYNTTIYSGDGTVFRTPSKGIRNMTLGVIINANTTLSQNNSAMFVLQRTPFVPNDDGSIQDGFQIIRYSARVILPGNQTNETLSALGTYMGQGGGVNLLGWTITAPILLRDYDIVYDCLSGTLDSLLNAIAASVGEPRYLFNATCTALGPGDADSYIISTSSSPTGRKLLDLPSTGGLCGDARLFVNITYTSLLSDTKVISYAQLTSAMSILSTAVTYALGYYSSSQYCTAPLSVSTVATLYGGVTSRKDYRITNEACSNATSVALGIISNLASSVGLTITFMANSLTCEGSFNCIDCWPYDITQLQIVLMACAALLLVVLALAIRLKIVRRLEDRQPVPAGVLDVRRTTAAIEARQKKEREEIALNQPLL